MAMDELSEKRKENLLSEVKMMALLVLDTYFPDAVEVEDFACRNCQSYKNRNCGGKRLDFDGIINCMVDKAIHGAESFRECSAFAGEDLLVS